MINLKNQKPKLGQWIVWVAVEHRGGHHQAGVSKYTKEMEEQLIADDMESFWYYAEAPARAMLKANLVSIDDELAEIPEREYEIKDRREKVTDELEEVEDALSNNDDGPSVH